MSETTHRAPGDLQNYACTRADAANVNTPTWVISGQITDGNNNVVADYTGENAAHFPSILGSLTTEQQDDLVQSIAITVLLMLAGLG